MRFSFLLALVAAPLGSTFVSAQEPLSLTVEPARLTLTHAGDEQRLLVTGKRSDGTVLDVTRLIRFESANPAIATVGPDGMVRPVGVGETVIRIVNGKTTALANVTVASVAKRPVSFANDVMPLLAKAGCNSGACHGSASGKKGFKVSLRGYDPATDYLTLTRGNASRRLNLLDPGQSLLLLKPTGQSPHEGGKRFDSQSPYAEVLRRWVAEGAKSDLAAAPRPIRVEVSPAVRTFAQPGEEQQLLVRAHFSDGSVRDVTRDCRYSSSNELAAVPEESGKLKLLAKGEAAIMVRYASLVAVSNAIILKYDPNFVWTDPPEVNFVDKLVNAKLRSMQILPSDLSSDVEFLRRVHYDLIGLPPTPAEVRAFLADKDPKKRARKIDELLGRPEHAEFWAQKWADLFRLRFDLLRDKGTWGFYRWIRDSIAANKPFDRFVTEILTASGSTDQNPPANFWRVFSTTEDATEATTQVFLGIRLQCARCHDHPFEKWVQKDYYGFAAFFSQVGRKAGPRREDQVIFCGETAAQARHSTTGEVLDPKFLDGASIKVGAGQDARQVLARWLTSKDNPYLARATVNRLWSHLLGRGLIDPVDDIRSSNPPLNAPLLDALARDFIEHGYDEQYLLRTILNSRTYQLASRTNPTNAGDRVNFSHNVPRRLSAEQMLDTFSQITGVRETFRSRVPGVSGVALPVGGVRASQLPDRVMSAEMLDLFGRPRGESSCTCERTEEASLVHALHLINSGSMAKRLSDPNGVVARLVKTAGITEKQLIEELFLLGVCRFPTEQEQATISQHFAKVGNTQKAAEDLLWALLNSREFLFNH